MLRTGPKGGKKGCLVYAVIFHLQKGQGSFGCCVWAVKISIKGLRDWKPCTLYHVDEITVAVLVHEAVCMQSTKLVVSIPKS